MTRPGQEKREGRLSRQGWKSLARQRIIKRKETWKSAVLQSLVAVLFVFSGMGSSAGQPDALSGQAIPCYAAQEAAKGSGADRILGRVPVPTDATLPGLSFPAEAAGVLAVGLAACEESIDLSPYAISTDRLGELFTYVMNSHPELFHVAGRLGYTYNRAGQVLSVSPSYTLAGEALTAARRLYRQTVEAFCADLEAARRRVAAFSGLTAGGSAGGWSQADTVLFLHDWLADRYAYDLSGTRFDAYSLFRDGVGVCQAYALAFLALGKAAGLEVDMVTSTAMDHAWNHVRVDGVWYHVDVTRDDPIVVGEEVAPVNHDRFLLSDGALDGLGYHDYACAAGHTCVDTRFEGEGGVAVLAACHRALLCLGNGWFTCEAEGGLLSPVVWPPDGLSVSPVPGDADRDGVLTPADLLTLYLLLPEDASPLSAPERLALLARVRTALLAGA